MELGVANADVIIAVVSPQYVESKNCGFELELANKHQKEVIPVVLGLPFDDWLGLKKVGETELKTQFHDAATGDGKLFVDFTDLGAFETKFEQELRPRIERQFEPTPFDGIIARLQSDDGIGRLMSATGPGDDAADGTAGSVVPKELRRSAIALLTELGAGAFGTVHKAMMATASGVEYLVAVKQLRVDASSDGGGAAACSSTYRQRWEGSGSG